MRIISIPTGWPEVTEEDFVEFLKTCPDYRRDSYADHSYYYFAHNKFEFARIVNDKIFVHPSLIENLLDILG